MLADGLEALRAAEAPLLVLGALTAAWLALRAAGYLLVGLRVWVLGNGRLVAPGSLGQWAGEALGAGRRLSACQSDQETHEPAQERLEEERLEEERLEEFPRVLCAASRITLVLPVQPVDFSFYQSNL